MKHVLILFSLLLMQNLGATTNFQDKEGMAKTKAKELTKKYQTDLDLKADQVAKFEEIVAAYLVRKAKAKKLNVADSDKKVMAKQLTIQENEDMAALLSKGQYKKYLKSKAKLQP